MYIEIPFEPPDRPSNLEIPRTRHRSLSRRVPIPDSTCPLHASDRQLTKPDNSIPLNEITNSFSKSSYFTYSIGLTELLILPISSLQSMSYKLPPYPPFRFSRKARSISRLQTYSPICNDKTLFCASLCVSLRTDLSCFQQLLAPFHKRPRGGVVGLFGCRTQIESAPLSRTTMKTLVAPSEPLLSVPA